LIKSNKEKASEKVTLLKALLERLHAKDQISEKHKKGEAQ